MTDDILARFQKSLAQMNQEGKSSLTEMIEITLGRKSPEIATGARHCSILRWFNVESLAALLLESPEQAQLIFQELKQLPYVHEINSLGYAYRSEVREYLTSMLRAQNEEQFLELHRRAHNYFDEKLRSQGIVAEETRWATLTQEQADNLREKLYHLLFIELEQGFELLDRLFQGAHRYRLFGEAATLVGFGKEHVNESLPLLHRLRLEYYDAVLAYADGKWEEAIGILQKILANKVLPSRSRAQVLSQLGTIYASVSQFDPAITFFEQSKKILDDLKDLRGSSGLANNLANTYRNKGELSQAEKFFTEGLAGLIKVGDLAEQAIAYNNLGMIHADKEKWEKAREFYNKSLEIKQQIGDHIGIAITQSNLGSMFLRMSEDAQDSRQEWELRRQAIDQCTLSIGILRQLNAQSELAMALYKVAIAYNLAGERSLARRNIREALDIFEALKLPQRDMARKLAERLGVL